MAARLSENPQVSVLLIKAGGWDRNPLIHVPIGWAAHPRGPAQLELQERAGGGSRGRVLDCPRGKVMGGTSSINTMAYVRGHRDDYDRLDRAGLAGWGYDDVLPFFRKQEDWGRRRDGLSRRRRPDRHGRATATRWAYAAASGDAGHDWTEDYNAQKQEGFSRMQLTLRNGRRCSTAAGYIQPAMKRRNCSSRGRRASGSQTNARDCI